jgi:hypothetical protein
VKTENPIACVTVNKVCKSVIALYCLQARVVYKVSMNPIIKSKALLISHGHTPTRNYILDIF